MRRDVRAAQQTQSSTGKGCKDGWLTIRELQVKEEQIDSKERGKKPDGAWVRGIKSSFIYALSHPLNHNMISGRWSPSQEATYLERSKVNCVKHPF